MGSSSRLWVRARYAAVITLVSLVILETVLIAVRRIPAHLVGLAALSEPVGATLLAWALPGIREVPPMSVLVGGALVLAGIAIGLTPSKQDRGSARRTG